MSRPLTSPGATHRAWRHSHSIGALSFAQVRPRLARSRWAPPAGFEPAHTAPEADALSPELWGLRDVGKATSQQPLPGHAAGTLRNHKARRYPHASGAGIETGARR